jgi:hypothetical protein
VASEGSAPPEGQDLGATVTAVSSARARAFTTRDPTLLDRADAPGSPALAADRSFVRRLTDRGVRLEGLHFVVSQVSVVRQGERAALVEARVGASAHVQHVKGRALPVPARTPDWVRLHLVRTTAGQWRIRSVE